MESEETGDKPDTKFKPGQSGNPAGRPKGARSKIAEAFLKDVLADWEANGALVLATLRSEKPDAYVRVVAELLPKELEVKGSIEHEHTHRSLSATAAWIAEVTGLGEGGALPESLPH